MGNLCSPHLDRRQEEDEALLFFENGKKEPISYPNEKKTLLSYPNEQKALIFYTDGAFWRRKGNRPPRSAIGGYFEEDEDLNFSERLNDSVMHDNNRAEIIAAVHALGQLLNWKKWPANRSRSVQIVTDSKDLEQMGTCAISGQIYETFADELKNLYELAQHFTAGGIQIIFIHRDEANGNIEADELAKSAIRKGKWRMNKK